MTLRLLPQYRCCLLALTLCPTLLAAAPQAKPVPSATPAPTPNAIADFGAAAEPLATPVTSGTPGGNYQVAKVRFRAPVAYPLLADLNREEGVVTIRFYIDETGHVTKTAVAKDGTSPLLNQLNNDSRLLLWTFDPATLDGKPIPSTHDQEFEFRLDPEQQKKLALHRLALSIGTPDPPYPPAAAANHLEGSATLTIQWTKQGLVDKIGLSKSSGSPLLDATALRFAYENWRIDPAAMSPDKPFVKTIKFTPPQ
jgi:TonB family protein